MKVMNVDGAGTTPALLDDDGVAALLLCSARHVQRMADQGRMPAPVRLGSLVRWPRAAIESWIAQGCPAAVDEAAASTKSIGKRGAS